jgi:hypothetical protein
LITVAIYLGRYIKKLAGRKDIENALGELDGLIQGEHYTVTAQVLQDTSELRRGAWPYLLAPYFPLNFDRPDMEAVRSAVQQMANKGGEEERP